MKINIHNYEVYILDFLDGNLELGLIKEMQAFLLLNPNIAEEIEGLQEIKLSPNSNDLLDDSFSNQLKKRQIIATGPIHASNYQEYFIGFWEGDLCPEDYKSMQLFLKNNPFLQSDFDSYKTIKLNPTLSVVYPSKASLKRKNKGVIALWSFASSVAALLLLAFWLFQGQSSRLTPNYDSIQPVYLSHLSITKKAAALEEASLLKSQLRILEFAPEPLKNERLERNEKLDSRENQLLLADVQWQNELLLIQSLTFDKSQMHSQIDIASIPSDRNTGAIKLISKLLWNTTKGQVKNMGDELVQDDIKLFSSNSIEELTGGIISIKKSTKEIE